MMPDIAIDWRSLNPKPETPTETPPIRTVTAKDFRHSQAELHRWLEDTGGAIRVMTGRGGECYWVTLESPAWLAPDLDDSEAAAALVRRQAAAWRERRRARQGSDDSGPWRD